ncbi:hypothetical protein Gpo141_00010328 [Globisporangium polare]
MISRLRSVTNTSALRVQRNAAAAPFIRGSTGSLFPAQALVSAMHPLPHTARRENATLANSIRPRTQLSPSSALVMASMRAPVLLPGMLARPVALGSLQVRTLSSRRNPWGQNSSNDWVTTAKAGALVVIGAGVLVASTSLAFGLIIAGAAGYGVYALYQKVFGPYRSHQSPGDLFGGVNSDIDRLNELFGRRKQQSSASPDATSSPSGGGAMGKRELDSLVQGLPLVVRGLVKTIFSFVGKAMQSSMQRAGELRRLANEHIQSHPRVVSLMGSGVSVSTPQQWVESTVNGVGRIEAVFPVSGSYSALVTAKASVGSGGGITLQELKFRNQQTGEVIDLLRDGGAGPRKTIVDAEYVEI